MKSQKKVCPSIPIILAVMMCVACSKKSDPAPGPPIDVDGNTYTTVTIGSQVWMVENLKVTKYKDGSAIPLVLDDPGWDNVTTAGGYCWYNNDAPTYKNPYGAIYHWYTVKTGKLCPTGWHVPTDDEWTKLTTFLGGESVAGGKMKEVGTSHWLSPNAGATNESGFTGLPGGGRVKSFGDIGNYGYWWSSTEPIQDKGWFRLLWTGSGSIGRYNNDDIGLSVRCLKD